MRVDGRRSTALAAAEHHYREMLRVRRIVVWGVLALVAMVTAAAAGHWMHTLSGYLLFAAAAGLFVSSAARLVASLSRNLLDPYRIREPWESRDWWSRASEIGPDT